jgi:hypothetical protein
MSGHTKGPWTINSDAHRHEPGFYGEPCNPGEEEVYTAIRLGESGVRLTGYIKPADTNLIAAAPELLEAAKRLRRVISDHVSLADVDALDAAISKAEGRS